MPDRGSYGWRVLATGTRGWDQARFAEQRLRENLGRIEDRHPDFSISLNPLDVLPQRIRIVVVIDCPGIWKEAARSRKRLEQRILYTLQKKFDGMISVDVTKGSLTISILINYLDMAQHIYDIINTVAATVEYVVTCIEEGRVTWPPTVLGAFHLFKRFVLGL